MAHKEVGAGGDEEGGCVASTYVNGLTTTIPIMITILTPTLSLRPTIRPSMFSRRGSGGGMKCLSNDRRMCTVR